MFSDKTNEKVGVIASFGVCVGRIRKGKERALHNFSFSVRNTVAKSNWKRKGLICIMKA